MTAWMFSTLSSSSSASSFCFWFSRGCRRQHCRLLSFVQWFHFHFSQNIQIKMQNVMLNVKKWRNIWSSVHTRVLCDQHRTNNVMNCHISVNNMSFVLISTRIAYDGHAICLPFLRWLQSTIWEKSLDRTYWKTYGSDDLRFVWLPRYLLTNANEETNIKDAVIERLYARAWVMYSGGHINKEHSYISQKQMNKKDDLIKSSDLIEENIIENIFWFITRI